MTDERDDGRDERVERKKWGKYYEQTRGKPPWPTLLKALELFNGFRGLAIDLGCGAGNDTKELLEKGWRVKPVDMNPLPKEMEEQLSDGRLESMIEKRFEELEVDELPKADLVNASFSIPFCKPEHFEEFWKKIVEAINTNGRFAGQFLGDRDEWKGDKEKTFLSKEEVEELFEHNGFMIESLIEKEHKGKVYDKETDDWKPKHWHVFNVVAIKKS